ncbi:MAG: SDR family oxidoreductase [Sphingomonas sp.]
MKIVVTGASGALGGAVTHRLQKVGHQVVGIDRHIGDTDIACPDLADEGEARRAMEAAADRLGGLDALVHLVGGFDWIPIEQTDIAALRKLFSVNVETWLASAKAAIPLVGDGGALVAVGAASAQPAGEGMGAYAAAKSGVARITEALAHELAPRRIRVNSILPAIIDTPRNRADMPDADPTGWTAPDAIADVIAFLVSPASRAINGAAVPVTNPG